MKQIPINPANTVLGRVLLLAMVWLMVSPREGAGVDLADRYLVVNLQQNEERDATFAAIAALAANRAPQAPRIGAGVIVSYLAAAREENSVRLRECFRLAERHNVAVLVQLDGEQWWQGRPDLWNWWDAARPGFDAGNVANVEWSGWGPEHALRIAWRNWGQQIRVLPPPNLMSPAYRQACHEEMMPLVAEVMRWKKSLGPKEAHLLIGVKVGWESSIGVNAYYYLNGNELLERDPQDDPKQAVQENELPGRGFQPIGYAAVTTAGLATSGELHAHDLTEVVRRHLADLATAVREQGLPREQVFVHCGGWAVGESLYSAALNGDSCPGWSFYKYATDPARDETAMAALRKSDAPYWAATEWYPHGARTADDWTAALRTTLAIDRCRYVNVYNWREVVRSEEALAGIEALMRDAGQLEEGGTEVKPLIGADGR